MKTPQKRQSATEGLFSPAQMVAGLQTLASSIQREHDRREAGQLRIIARQDVLDAKNERDVKICQELTQQVSHNNTARLPSSFWNVSHVLVGCQMMRTFTRHWDTPQGSLSCDSSVGATTTPLSEDTRKRASRDAATMMGRMNLIAKLEALKEDEDGTATEKVIHLLVGTTDLSNVESVGEVSAH